MMHSGKLKMKHKFNRLMRCLSVFALLSIGSNAAAQLISIERSVSVAERHESSTGSDDDDLCLHLDVQTAGFTTTEPRKLFAENVVYVDPSQEPFAAESINVLPPEISIPPMSEDPLELPLPPQQDWSQQDWPQPIAPQPSVSSGSVDESIHNFIVPDDDGTRLRFSRLMQEPYSVYRTEQSILSWLPGGGEHFGWLDWQSDPYLRRGNQHGFTGAINVHWLSGPISSPLPPRLYDFMLGYQVRSRISDQFSYDLFTSVGAYSDFEGSARKGIRFPSHAVGMFHINHSTDFVFGVDYLDRDDVEVLPVIGVSLRDVYVRGLRMDLVFPRPRIDYMLSEKNRMYLAGVMSGGTWQVEFPDSSSPVMTYRDFRLLLGIESTDKDGSLSAWELGYVFSRRLEFRNQPDDTHFDDAFVIQWVSRR